MSDVLVFESWSLGRPLRVVEAVANRSHRWTLRKRCRVRRLLNSVRRELRLRRSFVARAMESL